MLSIYDFIKIRNQKYKSNHKNLKETFLLIQLQCHRMLINSRSRWSKNSQKI